MVLPYGGKMSEEIKANLKKLVNKFFLQIDFNFMFKTPRSIENFFNF